MCYRFEWWTRLFDIGLLGITLGIPSIGMSGLGALFMAVLPISISERAVIMAGSTILGVPVLKVLGSSRLTTTIDPSTHEEETG